MLAQYWDPVSSAVAQPLHMDAALLTDRYLPELTAWVAEVPAGLLFTGLGQLVIGVILGVAFLALAAMSTALDPRDKEYATGLSAHFLTHPNAPGLWGVLTPGAASTSALVSNLQSLRAAVASGSGPMALSAFFYNPSEIGAYFQSVGAQFNSLMASAALPGIPGVPGVPGGFPAFPPIPGMPVLPAQAGGTENALRKAFQSAT